MESMKMIRMRRLAIGLSVFAFVAGCTRTSAQQTRTPAPGDAVAMVGSTAITLSQVDQKAMQTMIGDFGNVKLSQALYDARRSAIDQIVDEMLIEQDAKARKVTVDAVLAQEITSKVSTPAESDIAGWYKANQDRLQGAPLEAVHDGISKMLVKQRTAELREDYIDRLRAKVSIKIALDPPRQTIATAGHPSRGPANAPIEIVEFSDFQCPFCLRAFPTVVQVLNEYGDRIHFVYRHFPLQMHPNARPAAEAAACAAEQGKFWEYHDELFRGQARLSDSDLKQHAATVGVDTAKFNSCVDSHKYRAQVDSDLKDGEEAGVTGTPAFFINGRSLSGAQPYEVFKRTIEEELSAKKR
jgi:protein-disulfide isomerase